MRSNDRKGIKRLLDQVNVEEPSVSFERLLYQDWQKTIRKDEKFSHRFSEALALAKLHPKLVIMVAIVAITASVLLGQHLLISQDEELHRIDVLSELSLSTI